MLNLPEYTQRLRSDLRHAQIYNQTLLRSCDAHKKKIEELEKKNKQLEKELKKVKKENGNLKKEIEKITKTNNRYQVALFDHGNFTHPSQKDKKPNGGQKGHTDTNRDSFRNYSSFTRQRLFATHCGKCGSHLRRAHGVKEKTLIDIHINTDLMQVIFQSERQWCKNCRKEVTVRSVQTLPFTEYGMNTFMVVMLLRFRSHNSIQNISNVLSFGFGLTISKAGILSLLRQAEIYLATKYEELKDAIQKGQVIYQDETGWLVKGKRAWMWIMTNEEKTVYVAAESRGKGIAEEMYGTSQAKAMTDGYISYFNTIPKDKHLYCWAHILRFAFEETVQEKKPISLALQIRDRLVSLYQKIRTDTERSKEEKEQLLRTELDLLLSIKSKNQTVQHILQRLKTQKEGLIYSLLETPDGTNNLAERELRNMALKRSISNGSQTFQGMQTTAILNSIVQTITRNKKQPFLSTLEGYLHTGIQEIYPQYKHLACLDT